MSDGAVLTDAVGMGGVIALAGFDYQYWNALIRIPGWLANPAFDGFIVEGLEDFEARFLTPYSQLSYALDRYQVKSAVLKPAGIKELFALFASFDRDHAGTVRSHTLVTPGLPSGMEWLARDQKRVKQARTFYRPFGDILQASEARLINDFRDTFGDDGGTYANTIDVELTSLSERRFAEAMFLTELDAAFPDVDVAPKAAARAFATLLDRLDVSRGAMITRGEIFATLQAAGIALADGQTLTVRIRGGEDIDAARTIDIDGAPFAGVGGFPQAPIWVEGLVTPLKRIATWAAARGLDRVRLEGRYRLSTAFAVGWAFRSASGFDIDIPTRDSVWPTDAHPTSGQTNLPWQVASASGLVQGRLQVAIGVLRDPLPAIHATLGDVPVLRIFLNQAIRDATEAQESVREIKRAIDAATATAATTGIDLYVVGPAAMVVALGHRWNGLPPTQVHEFDAATGRYLATAQIS